MKKIKFLIGAVVIALALVLVSAPVDAGSLAVAVDLTGVDVCNFNIGGVDNFVYTGANSGRNFTLWGDSNTGSAVSSASVATTLNSNSTAVAICDFESGPVAVNLGGDGGGPGPCWPFSCFGKIAIAADLTMVKVSNFNAGLVINGVLTMANSGHNWTIAGDSMTGNANASANVSTNLNFNSTSVSVMEGGAGPMAINLGGDYALAVALEADLVKVTNKNFGMVANCVNTSANSGRNLTVFGSSGTGNATARAVVSNTVNSNRTSVSIADASSGPIAANVDSELGPCLPDVGPCGIGGGPTAVNDGTGGVAVAAEVDAVEVSNVNVGGVYNDVDTSANTGGNVTVGCPVDPCADPCEDQCGQCDSVCGLGGGESETSSDTGNASASSTVENTVNTNSTTVVIGGGI